MCGINGIYAYHNAASPIDREELIRTRDQMGARGPDGKGEWLTGDARIGLGHRRLSIIDLSEAGAQPMLSADGRFAVTFNGEIYNYRALRCDLEERGCVFQSHSDTEVLLHLYAEKAEAMVHQLRGMFAFAIWDAKHRKLFLARDPYGIKPLYYADDGRTFRFASQVKALLAGEAISRDAEPAGLAGFYLFGSIPEPFTLYRGIRALPAGSMLTVDCIGAHEPRRYHSIAEIYCNAEMKTRSRSAKSESEARAEIREALLDSVRHHLVADVPVGAFLSAGIDSSALVGLMRDAGQQQIQTVTIGFSEFQGRAEDEAPLAEEVARRYGTRHVTRVVTETEFATDLPRILDAMDQPSIDGVNTWFVSKAAHELGFKVAISGLGGDELFGGYPSFRDIPRWVRVFRLFAKFPRAGRAGRHLLEGVAGALGKSPKLAGMLEYGGTFPGAYLLRRGLFMPWELPRLMDADAAREGLDALNACRLLENALQPSPESDFAKVAVLEFAMYMRNQLLRDTDWASMAHSLEVRVPLVDASLLAKIAPMAVSETPGATKMALAHAPQVNLPASITGRAKTGFAVPIGNWIRTASAAQDARKPRHTRGRASRDWSRFVHATLAASATGGGI